MQKSEAKKINNEHELFVLSEDVQAHDWWDDWSMFRSCHERHKVPRAGVRCTMWKVFFFFFFVIHHHQRPIELDNVYGFSMESINGEMVSLLGQAVLFDGHWNPNKNVVRFRFDSQPISCQMLCLWLLLLLLLKRKFKCEKCTMKIALHCLGGGNYRTLSLCSHSISLAIVAIVAVQHISSRFGYERVRSKIASLHPCPDWACDAVDFKRKIKRKSCIINLLLLTIRCAMRLCAHKFHSLQRYAQAYGLISNKNLQVRTDGLLNQWVSIWIVRAENAHQSHGNQKT